MARSITPEELAKTARQLRALRKEYGVRAVTLVPDLAFVALINDTLDATDTALELLNSPRPYRGYAMARVAVEATQRLLVIATADDYVTLGTRAWLYYRRKDADLRNKSDAELGPTELQILGTWAHHEARAQSIVKQQLSELRAQKKPDNFLGRSLAAAVTEAYTVIAAAKGTAVPADATEVNQAFYSSLSREAHACLRLEPASFQIDSDGFVEVVEQARLASEVSPVVLGALEVTLREAIEAVRYRLSIRRKDNAAALETATLGRQAPTEPTYADDFGCFLLEQGLGQAETVFPLVPFMHIRELPDQTLTSTLRCHMGTETRAGTFDFKGPVRDELLALINHRFSGFELRRSAGRLRIDLPEPLPITITAVLGTLKRNDKESFIPLIVTRLRT